MTDDFKMRFYFNFDAADEYVYLDNINIFSKVDPSVFFKIDGEFVYFDGSGNPQTESTANHEIFADVPQFLPTLSGGYSYACRKDVTDLVLAYTQDDDGLPGNDGDETNDIYHPGIATYTVGDVGGSFGDQLSHAGWSLVLVYSSPTTRGHYLFLYDNFTFAWGEDDANANNDSLDFDNDGQCGGTVSGFIVPEPLPGEQATGNAAKMTMFVGEGDALDLRNTQPLSAIPAILSLSMPLRTTGTPRPIHGIYPTASNCGMGSIPPAMPNSRVPTPAIFRAQRISGTAESQTTSGTGSRRCSMPTAWTWILSTSHGQAGDSLPGRPRPILTFIHIRITGT